MIKGTDIRQFANPNFRPQDEEPEQEEEETPEPEEEIIDDPEEEEIEQPDPEEEEIEDEDPEPKPNPEPKPKAPEKPEIDYKEKFANSTREAQVLAAKNKELEKAIDMLTKEEVPSDEELAQLNPNWEFLSDFEKDTYRDVQTIKRQNARDRLQREQLRQEQAKQDALNSIYANDPQIAAKKAEFEAFISKDSRKSIPAEDLVAAFKWEFRDELDKPSTPGRKIQKRPVLQDRSAGGKITPKVVDETERLTQLRKRDPQAYHQEMLRRSRQTTRKK